MPYSCLISDLFKLRVNASHGSSQSNSIFIVIGVLEGKTYCCFECKGTWAPKHCADLSWVSRNTAGHDLLEGDPEVQVEHRVNDGVERRVDVAQPRYELDLLNHMNYKRI